MKLNEKGFAFSTLLYGIFAVILVVLILIFSLYSNASNEAYYYASSAEETLNRCVEQEVELEKCYATQTTCDASAYYACIGADNNTISGKRTNLYTYLVNRKVTGNTAGLQQVSGGSLDYYFRGPDADVKNYISFSGENWRIIGISNKGIKIGLFNGEHSVKWDANGGQEWSRSSIKNYLNGEFYNSLVDKQLISEVSYDIGRFKSSTAYKKSGLKTQEKTATVDAKVGTLTPTDLVMTSLESTCTNDAIALTQGENNGARCRSWVSDYPSWLMNATETNATYPKAFRNHPGAAGMKVGDVGLSIQVVPVVYLNTGVEIIEGAGSGESGSPFILGR